MMRNDSAQSIRNLILDRLTTGTYSLGSKLPTARELATELGVHRNTVTKAYRMLADLGLVTSQKGRGTFVVAQPDNVDGLSLAPQIFANLENLVHQARRVGILEHQLRDVVEQQMAAAYHPQRQGTFIECNTGDIEAGISEIETMTGIRLAPLHLKKVEADPAKAVDGYTLVFTSLIHSKEVSDLLQPVRPDLQIIGVYTQPDEEAMAQIAQIPPGSCVGIVVDIAEGARRFECQINTLTAVTTRALVMPSDGEIRRLAQDVDAIVCSRARASQVRSLQLPIPIIELKFHVSRQSATRVIEALIEQRKPTPRPAAHGEIAI